VGTTPPTVGDGARLLPPGLPPDRPPPPRLLSLPLPPTALALGLVALIYGVAGAPVPSAPGLAEAAIGLLLLAAVGLRRPLDLVVSAPLLAAVPRGPEIAACLALLLAVWPGLLRGMFMGWPLNDILRDMLPLAFLFLPVLIRPRSRGQADGILTAVGWGMAAAGFTFALRWWIDLDVSYRVVGAAPIEEQPPFVLKSAALPFAAVWCTAQAARRLGMGGLGMGGLGIGPDRDGPGPGNRHPLRRMLAGGLLLLAALVCLGALAGAVHRAGFILAALACALVLGWRFRSSAGAWLIGLACLAAAWVLWSDTLAGLIHLALEKTQTVGINNRSAEFAAVVGRLMDDPAAFLIGLGWGGQFRNPAVGGIPVTYTHNLASYLLLKVGVLGLLGIGAYLAAVLARGLAAWRARPDLVLALMPSLLMGLMLHTSYKYMCFGLLLLLLRIAGDRAALRED
jgi:hypothetical protein